MLQSMYNTAVRVKAVGAAFLIVLIGSCKSRQVNDTVSLHYVGVLSTLISFMTLKQFWKP